MASDLNLGQPRNPESGRSGTKTWECYITTKSDVLTGHLDMLSPNRCQFHYFENTVHLLLFIMNKNACPSDIQVVRMARLV